MLIEEFKLTEQYIAEAATSGNLLVNRCVCHPHDVLCNGDLITHKYIVQEPSIQTAPILVLAENEHLVVVDKPAGLPCHPQGKFHRASLTEIPLGGPRWSPNRISIRYGTRSM